ncbi:MAG: DUF5678 domain-containing protein [Thermoplasmatota archaeon]
MTEEALLLARMEDAQANARWLADNFVDLQRDYGGRYIIVHNKGIVASGRTMDEASQAATKARLNLDDTLIDYVPLQGESWVL